MRNPKRPHFRTDEQTECKPEATRITEQKFLESCEYEEEVVPCCGDVLKVAGWSSQRREERARSNTLTERGSNDGERLPETRNQNRDDKARVRKRMIAKSEKSTSTPRANSKT